MSASSRITTPAHAATAAGPARQRSGTRLTLTIAAVMLLSFGAVMIFFGASYLRDVGLLDDAPGAAWDAICGRPIQSDMNAPLMLGAGIVASSLAAGLFWFSRVAVQRGVLLSAALVCALVAAATGYAFNRAQAIAVNPGLPPSGAFTRLGPPRDMPNFILRNTEGGMSELRDLRGRTVLMFFGYTRCPDVCPTTLADYKQIKKALGSDADKVAFVFISVDGERDTPAFLKKYVRLFDADFIALTAHSSVVQSIERDYGGVFEIDRSQSDDSYTVIHTADTYVLDARGRWRLVLPLGMPVDEVVNEIRAILAENAR